MNRAEATGLDGIRSTLEHDPRDPFAVDVPAALEELAAEFGTLYCPAYIDGQWRAMRIGGTGDVLTGDSPDELRVAMLADWRAS